MANELPPVESCTTTTATDECCDASSKCYSVKEALPACAATQPADELSPTGCTKLDATYDKILQAAVIPAVGSETQLTVCNPAVYTVGQWIELVDGSAKGSVFQITTINAIAQYIKVRNSCEDGVTAIDGNASPGSTVLDGTRFVVRGKVDCKTDSEKADDLEALIPELVDVCFDGVSDRAVTEEAKMLGVLAASDCVAGDVQACLRKLLTRELKDGTLKLGNVDETPEIIDTTLRKLYADVSNRVVIGEEAEEIFKWLFSIETSIASHASDPGGEQTYAPPSVPSGATHAIVQVHMYVDDNPAGNIMVKFGSVRPVRGFTSWGEAYTVANVSVPIDNTGNIKYELVATDGGVMDFSGSTRVDLFLLGYEKITTL